MRRSIYIPRLGLSFAILEVVLDTHDPALAITSSLVGQTREHLVLHAATNTSEQRRGPLVQLQGKTIHLGMMNPVEDVFYWHIIRWMTRPASYTCRPRTVTLQSADELRVGQHFVCKYSSIGSVGGDDEVLPRRSHAASVSRAGDTIQYSASTSSTDEIPSSGLFSVPSDSDGSQHHGKPATSTWVLEKDLRQLVLNSQRDSTGEIEHISLSSETRSNSDKGKASAGMGPPKSPEQKRRRQDDSDEEGDQDSWPAKKSTNLESYPRSRFLACPFWKLDPEKHQKCFLEHLDKISRVKQHLHRRHTPDFYCPRCFTIFQTEQGFHWHMIETKCDRQPDARLDALSIIQSKLLSRHSRRYGSVEEQWYAMWDIIFPGQPWPLSIYMVADQSEDRAMFREFAYREGMPRNALQQQLLLAADSRSTAGSYPSSHTSYLGSVTVDTSERGSIAPQRQQGHLSFPHVEDQEPEVGVNMGRFNLDVNMNDEIWEWNLDSLDHDLLGLT